MVFYSDMKRLDSLVGCWLGPRTPTTQVAAVCVSRSCQISISTACQQSNGQQSAHVRISSVHFEHTSVSPQQRKFGLARRSLCGTDRRFMQAKLLFPPPPHPGPSCMFYFIFWPEALWGNHTFISFSFRFWTFTKFPQNTLPPDDITFPKLFTKCLLSFVLPILAYEFPPPPPRTIIM